MPQCVLEANLEPIAGEAKPHLINCLKNLLLKMQSLTHENVGDWLRLSQNLLHKYEMLIVQLVLGNALEYCPKLLVVLI